jgi:hypothetical protein
MRTERHEDKKAGLDERRDQAGPHKVTKAVVLGKGDEQKVGHEETKDDVLKHNFHFIASMDGSSYMVMVDDSRDVKAEISDQMGSSELQHLAYMQSMPAQYPRWVRGKVAHDAEEEAKLNGELPDITDDRVGQRLDTR